MQTVNLVEEWRLSKRRAVRETKLWAIGLIAGLISIALALGLLFLQIPGAAQERDKWALRAEQLITASAQTKKQTEMPLSTEVLESARTRCAEFSLSFTAVVRLLPKGAVLHEVTLSHSQEIGLGISLRGSVQGFEPIRIYTDRLRQIGLFSDVTPLSVNRNDGENAGAQGQFEIRITLPANAVESGTDNQTKEDVRT
jgi:hypothetical protein